MAKFSLRRYEDQATVSLVLSVLGLLGLLPLIYLVFRHINWEQRWIWYNAKSARLILVLFFTAFSGGMGFLAFVMGINSAGQRRNTNAGRSWLGFFLGAAGMLAAFLLLALFWYLKKPMAD